jgi:hypothetical protein
MREKSDEVIRLSETLKPQLLEARKFIQDLANVREDLKSVKKQVDIVETLIAEITDIYPKPAIVKKGEPKKIALTVSRVRLDTVPAGDLRVAIGSKEVELAEGPDKTNPGQYIVKFVAPARPPDTDVDEYAPALLVGKNKIRVGSQAGLSIKYVP